MTSYRNSDPRPAIMQGSPPQLVPPRMDWDRPPWNRWAFQNIRQILPTAEVWRGDAPVRALPRQEQDLDALPVASIKGAVTTLARLLDDTYTDGFIVLKDGESATEEEMIRWCKGRLAKFKVPTAVEFRSELPKTMVGKILRRKLREEELAKEAKAG